MLLCLGPVVPLPPLNAGLSDSGCLLGTLRTPGPLCGVKQMDSKIAFSLKEPVEFNFFFPGRDRISPCIPKTFSSPTSQVLLPLSGRWLGKPNPFWLTGQALVPIPQIRQTVGGSVS